MKKQRRPVNCGACGRSDGGILQMRKKFCCNASESRQVVYLLTGNELSEKS